MTALYRRLTAAFGPEVPGLLGFLALVILVFSLTAPNFLTGANFGSIAFQLPELGLLTLAMLMPIISGGFNLAIIYTANMAGLTLAFVLNQYGGVDAGIMPFLIGTILALLVGAASGAAMGAVIAYVGAHPILVSLAMMIFLRGLGEFLTKGGDISGFPPWMATLGHGTVAGIPVPLILFSACAVLWHILLTHTRHGFSVRMIGSNIRAAAYSGLHTKRTLVLIYTLSGVMCAIAGILMLSRFNSVRVGHGEALLLVTVLACFLGGVDPFGGFGRVLPVVIALIVLQVLSSGLNLMGANQHLSTAVWGLFLVGVMILRWGAGRISEHRRKGR
ncbi:ABC transporter permease [Tabrizicola sp.]|uniref:ABC transporter permease n=1 Tax=Tabrizicola sp. TaxID=2005166 RepID=UPI0025E6D152|nr:ABC transporter permease [Tabrizicola sp.]MBY0351335.1 ABC transporter permease [Tabrizicola sp.]